MFELLCDCMVFDVYIVYESSNLYLFLLLLNITSSDGI